MSDAVLYVLHQVYLYMEELMFDFPLFFDSSGVFNTHQLLVDKKRQDWMGGHFLACWITDSPDWVASVRQT